MNKSVVKPTKQMASVRLWPQKASFGLRVRRHVSVQTVAIIKLDTMETARNHGDTPGRAVVVNLEHTTRNEPSDNRNEK